MFALRNINITLKVNVDGMVLIMIINYIDFIMGMTFFFLKDRIRLGDISVNVKVDIKVKIRINSENKA